MIKSALPLYSETRNRLKSFLKKERLLSEENKLYTIYKPYKKKWTLLQFFLEKCISVQNIHTVIGKYIWHGNYKLYLSIVLNYFSKTENNFYFFHQKRRSQNIDFQEHLFSTNIITTIRLIATLLILIGCNPTLRGTPFCS